MTTGSENTGSELTTRELEVLRALGRGLSNKEIAAELYIGVETVKSHLSLIYRKLDVTRRGQAVAWLNARTELAGDPAAPVAAATVRSVEGGVLVTLTGEYDLTAVQLLADAVAEARRSGPATVDLDMGGVVFMDSSALRVLVGLRTGAGGGPATTVRIVAVSPQVRRVLEYADLLSLFGLDDTDASGTA